MVEVSIALFGWAFLAGLLTFLAPCTLPLLPAYLGFISGVSLKELDDPARANEVRKQIALNGLFFVIGFSLVFILFGSLVGVLGQGLVPYRMWFAKIGGLIVVILGLSMLRVFSISFLQGSTLALPPWLTPGKWSSSLLVGGAFAFGWTPCVGPILASILLLASTKGSALAGAALLSVFSLGLAIPFLLVSFGLSRATRYINSFFVFLQRFRAPILALVGLVLGVLANVALIGLGTLVIVPHAVGEFGSYLYEELPWLSPLLFAALLGWWGYRKPDIDVLSVIGGSFLIVLGLLLMSNSFGFVIQVGYQLFGFVGYERLLDFL